MEVSHIVSWRPPIRKQLKYGNDQSGAALLTTTTILLVVSSMSVLTMAGISQLEQRISGNNVRASEVYSAAVGTLDYGMSWLEQNYTSIVWSDEDNDSVSESGDTAIKELAIISLNTDSYSRRVTYKLRTAENPDVVTMPRIIDLAATSVAVEDSHVSKTVFTTVLLGSTKLLSSSSQSELKLIEIPGSWRDF